MNNLKPKDRVLSFETGHTQVLTLDELKQTQSINHEEIPEHFEFFGEICDLLKKAKIQFEIENIYVNDQGPSAAKGAATIKRLNDKYGKNNIQAYLIRRALSLIKLTKMGNEEMTYSIALNYLQDGVQGAVGHNVHICKNMCIYGDRIISTFGSGRANNISYNQFVEHFAHWIANIKKMYESDLKIIEQLKATAFDPNSAAEFFGTLMFVCMGGKNFNNSPAPFNETEAKDFQRKYLGEINGNKKEGNKVKTLWDFINIGTSVASFESTDPIRILSANRDINTYVMNEFIPEAEIVEG